jgi:hypothetical protein
VGRMADREFLVSLLGSLGTSLAAAHFSAVAC